MNSMPPVSVTGKSGFAKPHPVPQRDMLIDVVRGIAISLVALGHTNQGVSHRGWWGNSAVGTQLDLAIYAFHMPAFFFVSGVFLRPGVEKRGEKLYTLGKLKTILYPYVLWTFLSAAATIPFAPFMLQSTPRWRTIFLGIATGNISWFLPALFFALMIGMLCRRIPVPLLFALSVLLCISFPFTNIGFLERGVRLLPFLVAGMWVGRSHTQMQRIPFAVAGALSVVCAIVIVLATRTPYWNSIWMYLALGFVGTLMLILVARCLGSSSMARSLAWIGAASFGVFLMSAYPQGAAREVLLRIFHIAAPWPQLIFPTLPAVLVPAWLYHHRIRLHINWMFVWPF